MKSTLVGYCPKRRTTRSCWVSRDPEVPQGYFPWDAPVEEICSVSRCVAKVPDGWRDCGKRNVLGMYDRPEVAWSTVPIPARPDFELFAYRLLLVRFGDGQEEPMEEEEWWKLAVEPMSRSFVRLGWDAVEESFGCSPVSCNVGCVEVNVLPLNRYCLVDTEEEGIELARSFSISKPEPGPYCVVEVWRDENSTAYSNSADGKVIA